MSVVELGTDVDLQQECFNGHISSIASTLESRGISYAVVGGLALHAHLGEAVPHRRLNGSIPDFDALGLGPNRSEIESVVSDLHERAKQPGFPEVGLEPCIFGERSQNGGRMQMLSSLRVDKGRYFLGYGSIEQEIDPATMRLVHLPVNGVELPCLSAKTTLFRYLLRGGVVKPKDVEKLGRLYENVLINWRQQPDDSCYGEYLDFVDRVQKQYPGRVGLYEAYWRLDKALGNRISGSKGMIYSLIGNFRK